jgi:hypothetical protein
VIGPQFERVVGCGLDGALDIVGGRQQRHGFPFGVVPVAGEFTRHPDGSLAGHSTRDGGRQQKDSRTAFKLMYRTILDPPSVTKRRFQR